MTDSEITPINWRRTSTLRAPIAFGGPALDTAQRDGRAPASADRLAASFELMTALLADTSLVDVLTLVVERARPMAGAALAFMALPDAVENTLAIDIATGLNADRVRGLSVRMGTSMIGRVFTSRRALASRVATDPPLKGLPTGPILLLPFDTGERTCGVLAVAGGQGDLPFSASTRRQLLIFASTSAAMIEIAEERREHHPG